MSSNYFTLLDDQLIDWFIKNEHALFYGAAGVLAITTFAVALKRGWGVWAPLLVLFIPLGAIIALCLPTRRRCPECGRFNFAAARICRHCGRDIPAPPPLRRRPPLIP
jgi:hypothetical protein